MTALAALRAVDALEGVEADFLTEDIEPEGVTLTAMMLLSIFKGDVDVLIAKIR